MDRSYATIGQRGACASCRGGRSFSGANASIREHLRTRMPDGKLEQLATQLKALSESLAAEEPSQLQPPNAKRVRKTINEAYEKLRKVMEDLDPIKHPGFVFDPSNPNIAGRIAGITMIAQ